MSVLLRNQKKIKFLLIMTQIILLSRSEGVLRIWKSSVQTRREGRKGKDARRVVRAVKTIAAAALPVCVCLVSPA